jgi:alpha,alpha-trehalose phosphorylase
MSWIISSSRTDSAELLVEESLFFTGNGYVGIRGNFEEGMPNGQKTIRGTYINAFHDSVSIPYGEKLYAFPETQQKIVNVVDAQSIEIFFGTERFSLDSGEVLYYQRQLHLDKGFTERIIHWRSPSGKVIKLCFKRLVSLTEKEIFIQSIEFESEEYTGPVRIVSTVNGDVANFVDSSDPRVASGHAKLLSVTDVKLKDDLSYVECQTTNTNLKTACAASYWLSERCKMQGFIGTDKITTEISFDFSGKASFEKKNIYVDTLRHGDNLWSAAVDSQRRLSELRFYGFLVLQEAYLNSFWEDADIEIGGDANIQEGIRFNLFHLLQSAGRDRFSNIPAKGLSGEGYEGHYFWDTEIYMLPLFLMTQPKLAKRLLLYRYSILEQARGHAKEMGHKQGALYPWRTISGTECSSYFPSGSAQYHISADIAYSFIQYYLVTEDTEFMKTYGAEVLFETARLWADAGHFSGDSFKIDAVTGPDEYTCIVNNNYYTNVMAKYNLDWAVKIYSMLEDSLAEVSSKIGLRLEEVAAWKRAAEKMYLPYNQDLGINPQDDSFLQKAVWDLAGTPKDHFPLLLHYHPLTIYRYQVCKQADTVLAHFLLEDEQDFESIQNSFHYYEKITTHDSSLSTCIFSIMASKLGDKQKAYDYFLETARLDLDNTHANTKDGLHMANMGGTWLAIVFGFAGLRIKEDGISFRPSLPDKWERYSFKLQYRGRSLKVEVTKNTASFQLLYGRNLPVKIFNQGYELGVDAPVVVADGV